MSSIAPTELSATAVIANIRNGTYPRETIVTIARGFLPLAQDDMIPVLGFLSASPDAEIAAFAHSSLTDVPTRNLVDFAANEGADPDHLALLILATDDTTVLETLIRNRSLRDEMIIDLARIAPPPVQEIIVINQARIIRAPQIIEALLENPTLSAEARRRALENREEFFDKKERIRALQEELGTDVIADLSDDPIADLLELALQDKTPPEETPDLPPPPADDEKGLSIWTRVLKMSVAEKVQLAFKGDKTVRSILIRERNRLVATAAMRNPRISEPEVESIAGMRNVDEDVLRVIGLRRDWTSKYPIALALARNPKVPVGVVLPLINRLTLRDLKGLKDDKGVSEAVRSNARKLYKIRQKS
jgi:hypothetical protein